MDNTQKSPTVVSLCTGYGGLELGLERVFRAINVLAHVEIEAFAIANLVAKMETGQMVPAPVWTDVKTFNGKIFRGRADIVIGGYPCQPFSAAGKRKGTDDPRHLWPYIRSIIMDIQPGWVFFENVEGHLSLGISEVLADLEEMGYRAEAGIFSASEVGAPHQRKRVFILGYSGQFTEGMQKTRFSDGSISEKKGFGPSSGDRFTDSSCQLADSQRKGLEGHPWNEQGTPGQELRQNRPACESCISSWPARPGQPQYYWEEPRVVANNTGDRRNEGREGITKAGSNGIDGDCGELANTQYAKRGAESGRICTAGDERREGSQGDVEKCVPSGCQAQSELGRTAYGSSGRVDPITNRVDRLRLLGNGVVPQTAEKAFRTLYDKLFDNEKRNGI